MSYEKQRGKLLVAYCKNDCNQKGLLQNCFYLQQISKKQLKLKPNLNTKKIFQNCLIIQY